MSSETNRSRKGFRWWRLLVTPVLALFAVWGFNAFVPRPTHLGIKDGELADCPDLPNCVCSQAESADHKIEPLRVDTAHGPALAQVKAAVLALGGARLITEQTNYLHFECVTPLLRFVDDLEFLADADGERVHVRSASRVGHSDLGTNHKRVEKIRARLTGRS